MNNLFWYTEKTINKETGEEKVLYQFFNMNCVLQSKEFPTGERIVCLNDVHETYQYLDIEKINAKGVVKSSPELRKMETVSEIKLSKEDNDRFKDLYLSYFINPPEKEATI
jgi:hypothetical protein